MEATKDSPRRFEERDSAGFRYSRKRRRLLKELSPNSKRRKSGEFFVRRSTEPTCVSSADVELAGKQIEISRPPSVSTSPTEQREESSKMLRDAAGNSSEARESKIAALLGQLDECELVLDKETVKLVEEKQKWDELVDVCTNRASEACRNADEEQDIKLGSDGLPVALTHGEREFLHARPNVQEIINKVESSQQEMEMTMSRWLHGVTVIEQYEHCIEKHLNQKKRATAEVAKAQIHFTPRTAIKGIINSKFCLSDCMK